MRQNTPEQKQSVISQVENDWLFLKDLDKDLSAGLAQSLVAEWTHSSTALEGNTISAGDTLFILTEGLTINGKSLREHQEIHGHAQALAIMSHWINSGLPLRIESLHQLHRSVHTENIVDIYQPVGSWKVEPNGTMVMPTNGKTEWHEYTLPKNVPPLIKTWLKMLRQHSQKHKKSGKVAIADTNTLITAYTDTHLGFVGIHPYADGNGRLARLTANIPLLGAGMPPLLISKEQRRTYINLLADYTLSIGQIRADQNIIKPGKEYNALKKFFLSQWQTTLDQLETFRSIQTKRKSIK
jgi:Fic family protein